MKLIDFCNDFITDCQIRDKSDLTVKSYESELDKMIIYFNNQNLFEVEALTTPSLREYFAFCSKSRNLKPVSVKKIMNVVRSLCKFGLRYEILTNSPMRHIDSPKIPKTLPDTLSEIELIKLIDTVESSPKYSLTEKVLIRFLAGTGVRRAELLTLQWKHINLEEKYVDVIGKGDKQRLIPLSDKMVLKLTILKEQSGGIPSDFVFRNNQGLPISKDVLSKLIFNLSMEAQIVKNITPHTFRRTFATLLIAKGVSVVVVQKLLGHDSIQSTQIYTRADIIMLKEAINCLALKNENVNKTLYTMS